MRAEQDVDRIITIPGQAVAPYYGQLQMALLRRKSHAILGSYSLAYVRLSSACSFDHSLKKKISPFSSHGYEVLATSFS